MIVLSINLQYLKLSISSMAVSGARVVQGLWTCFQFAEIGLATYVTCQSIEDVVKSKRIRQYMEEHQQQFAILEDIFDVLNGTYANKQLGQSLSELQLILAQKNELFDLQMMQMKHFIGNLTTKDGEFNPERIRIADIASGSVKAAHLSVKAVAKIFKLGFNIEGIIKGLKVSPADKFKNKVLSLMNEKGKKFALVVDPKSGKKMVKHVNLNPRTTEGLSLSQIRKQTTGWLKQNFSIGNCLTGVDRTLRAVAFTAGIYMAIKGNKKLSAMQDEFKDMKQLLGPQGKIQKNEEELMLALTLLACQASNMLSNLYRLTKGVQNFLTILEVLDSQQSNQYRNLIQQFNPDNLVPGLRWDLVERLTLKAVEMSVKYNQTTQAVDQCRKEGKVKELREHILQFLVFARQKMKDFQPGQHSPSQGKVKISVILTQSRDKINSSLTIVEEVMSSAIRKLSLQSKLLTKVGELPLMRDHEISEWKEEKGGQESRQQLEQRIWNTCISRTLDAINNSYVMPYLGEEDRFACGKEGAPYNKQLKLYLQTHYPDYKTVTAELLFSQFDRIYYDSQDGLSLFGVHKNDLLAKAPATSSKSYIIYIESDFFNSFSRSSVGNVLDMLWKMYPQFHPHSQKYQMVEQQTCLLFLPKKSAVVHFQLGAETKEEVRKKEDTFIQYRFCSAIFLRFRRIDGEDKKVEEHFFVNMSDRCEHPEWKLNPQEVKEAELGKSEEM